MMTSPSYSMLTKKKRVLDLSKSILKNILNTYYKPLTVQNIEFIKNKTHDVVIIRVHLEED